MIGIPKRKGFLVIALIAAVVLTGGIPLMGTSFAEEEPLAEEHIAYIIGYPDGEVKPLNRITREEAAVIFYRLMTEERRKVYASDRHPFADVGEGRWSNDEISALYNAGILQGYPDERYLPDKPISRTEFAAIAARFAAITEKSDQPAKTDQNNISRAVTQEFKFPDLESHWADQYVGTAIDKGWITGYGDGTFRPDNFIIRSEAMMLINYALNRRVNLAGLHQNTKQWPDNTEDKWYYEIVLEATNTHRYEQKERPKSTEKWTEVRSDPVW